MDTSDILDILKDAADRIINPRFGALDASQIDQKSHANDLVTVADREAEVDIASTLATIYPDAFVLGEEAHANDPTALDRFLTAEHSFTIDPIDGTLNFVNGSPDHAVMLAELIQGQVVRSWIWQPQHRVAFVAERGAGVTRNGETIPHSTSVEPIGRRLHTSHTPWHGMRLEQLGPLAPTWLCCGVDYPNLVSNGADVLVYRGKQMPWDHAPGSLMANEIGGFVGLADGSGYDPSNPRTTVAPATLIAVRDAASFPSVVSGVSAAVRL